MTKSISRTVAKKFGGIVAGGLIPMLLLTWAPISPVVLAETVNNPATTPVVPSASDSAAGAVHVNRTVPGGKAPSSVFSLPTPASTTDLEQVRLFAEPLTPVKGTATAGDNASLAAALKAYAAQKTLGALEAFVNGNPNSPWVVSVLTNLGILEYQRGYFSTALENWNQAWTQGQSATNPAAEATANRAVAELIKMYCRVGRLKEAKALLAQVANRNFRGLTANMIANSRQAVLIMENQPANCFKCGPFALENILIFLQQQTPQALADIKSYATTPQGTSLEQVVELASQVGLKMQVAKRVSGNQLPLPAVVNWKLDHYGALLRADGNRYLLQDPTFGTSQWISKDAVAKESSGYFLIPAGKLPAGWVAVSSKEAGTVWGRGYTTTQPPPGPGDTSAGGGGGGDDSGGGGSDGGNGSDDDSNDGTYFPPNGPGNDGTGDGPNDGPNGGPGGDDGSGDGSGSGSGDGSNGGSNDTGNDPGGDTGNGTGDPGSGNGGPCPGMAVWSMNAILASAQISDTPLFYTPPVGPAIKFRVNYNSKEQNQPATINYSNLGPLWNFSWLYSITFDSANAYVAMGVGGLETFSNFDVQSQSYAPDIATQSVLVKVSASEYQRVSKSGYVMIFNLVDPSGRIYMTQMTDRHSNSVYFTYDANFRLVALTDAIGQVSTLTYGSNTVGNSLFYNITKVTDPFGRFASFTYNGSGQLSQITDEIGITSQFTYGANDFIQTLTTPYGSTNFTYTLSPDGNTETLLVNEPNGAQQRMDAVFSSAVTPYSDPAATLPAGMMLENDNLSYRNSYYWGRKAMHDAPGDYTKAKLFHFLHAVNESAEGSVIESTKSALENRVWYHYQNQYIRPLFMNVGMLANPVSIGRVLDDGSTQLYQYTYNNQGYRTQRIDPLGRTTQYTYAPNGIDLLTVSRVTGPGASALLKTYTRNSQHEVLTSTDAAGETTTYTYNSRGQSTSVTDALGNLTTLTYNANGYLAAIDGPLAGTIDQTTFTYDGYGRVKTVTNGEGYSLSYSYDALNRLTSITYPDGTSSQITYTLLDKTQLKDRLGRITTYAYNSVRQLTSVTDPLNRVTQYIWCTCGALAKLIDPLGRATKWEQDVQGRKISKTYADGSAEAYAYENTTSRLKSVTDARGQVRLKSYNVDNTLASISYANTQVATPNVQFTYDPNYRRRVSMHDGIGLTSYSYNPIPGGVSPGAGKLSQVSGPWPNSTVNYGYDALGRVLSRSINGASQTVKYDAIGRMPSVTNALGAFTYAYQDASNRITNITLPSGQSSVVSYFGNTGDRRLQQIKNLNVNGSNLSEFDYTENAVGQIATWGQTTDANPAVIYNVSYDAANQVTAASATGSSYSYAYDSAGNRTSQTSNGTTTTATYDALNELQQVSPALGNDKSYTWDGNDRLSSITYTGTNLSTQFSYDGVGRCAQILEMSGGSVTSTKRFVWCGRERSEEHDVNNSLVRRFFAQGEQVNGTNYYYTRDHLGSIREMTDSGGNLHARYSYDPYGNRTKVSGDLDASLGFTGFYYHASSSLQLALYRNYDAQTGRWINRDPIAETGGINLYAYVSNNPVNRLDALGTSWYGTLAGDIAGGIVGCLVGAGLSGPFIGGGIGLGILAGELVDPAGGGIPGGIIGGLAGAGIAWTIAQVVGGIVSDEVKGAFDGPPTAPPPTALPQCSGH